MSTGPSEPLGLAAKGAFVSVRVFYLLLVRAFCAVFPFQISSLQVTESPPAYKSLAKHD